MARRSPSSRRAQQTSGFTLLEVLIVMALIGLVVASASRGMRSFAKSDLRETATKLAGSMRYLFDRASTTGRIHRLVIDFDEGKYWAEISDDRFYMPRERETEESREREAEEIAAEEEEKKQREEEMVEDESGLTIDVSKYEPQEFKPKRARFDSFKDRLTKPLEIPGAVKVASLFTPRLAEPVSSGKGMIYFFPLGMTEAAIVHLSDKDGETFYSLVIHPLTGRVRIVNGFVDPPIEEQFDDEGNRIEPEGEL